MPTADVIELEPLLSPIAGDKPTGADLRADSSPTSDYFKLKDARFAARAKEREIDGDPSLASGELPEWRMILDLAPKLLATQTKDLEIAAWMLEALLRRHGFPGLRDGFRLLRGLAEKYWDGLYPLPDEDGLAAKVAPLRALNGEGGDGTLIQPIRKVPVTDGGDEGRFASWQYERAVKMVGVTGGEASEWHADAGTVTLDQIKASQKATKPKFFIDLVDDIAACQAEFAALTKIFDEACGSDSPPTSTIRRTLEAVEMIARDLGADALAAAQAAAGAGGAAPSQGDGGAKGGQGLASGAVGTREEAFATLARVAEYFRRSEPHSPISYTLDELVRRGRMSLPELLNELITDSSQRRSFFVVAGMRPPEESQ
jgi:type VI secretion system protein ImpA